MSDSELDRLRRACSEFYLVIGSLAHAAGLFDDPQTQKALDNACAAAQGEPCPHDDLLPFTAWDVPPKDNPRLKRLLAHRAPWEKSMATERLCKDCAFVDIEPNFLETPFWMCNHPSSVYPEHVNVLTGALVSGKKKRCQSIRAGTYLDQDTCGREGKYFEPRE